MASRFEITLELPYPKTSGNHHTRHAAGRHYLTDDALAYRQAIKAATQNYGLHEPLTGPLFVHVVASPPDRRARDFDNLLKPMLDALTKAGFWEDDSNKVIQKLSLEWGEPTKGGLVLLTACNNKM